jgi:hypothetical protein
MRGVLASSLLLAPALGWTPPPIDRRAVLRGTAAAALAPALLPALPVAPAVAAQRGAEDPYAMQLFEQSSVCRRRTLLGACAEGGTGRTVEDDAPPKLLQATPDTFGDDSPLVQRLLQRTAENAEANDRLVRDKTVKAALPGTYGPFATKAPVQRRDGSFDELPFAKYDRLKDRGFIERSPVGLDRYVEGFDPDAPEPERPKFLGIF